MQYVIPERVARRLLSNRAKHGEPYYEVDENGCWIWLRHLTAYGYGSIGWNEDGQQYRTHAHRAMYLVAIGPLGDLVPDHLCRVRACVNPDHLEAISPGENVLRGVGLTALAAVQTHCARGHPFDEMNTYLYKGHRHCRTCRTARRAKHH